MATTTTNYGWDIPQSTDLVKDGATAIATLGQDIDTSVYTALGGNKSGLVLLNTTSFSAVSSQSINDVFSSTYQNYRILLYLTSASAGDQLRFRFRVSSADDSNNVYTPRVIQSFSSTAASMYDTSTRTFGYAGECSTTGISTVLEVFNPNAAARKSVTLFATQPSYTLWGGFDFTNSTSFTGFTIYPSLGGTITGSVRTYGYNQ